MSNIAEVILSRRKDGTWLRPTMSRETIRSHFYFGDKGMKRFEDAVLSAILEHKSFMLNRINEVCHTLDTMDFPTCLSMVPRAEVVASLGFDVYQLCMVDYKNTVVSTLHVVTLRAFR